MVAHDANCRLVVQKQPVLTEFAALSNLSLDTCDVGKNKILIHIAGFISSAIVILMENERWDAVNTTVFITTVVVVVAWDQMWHIITINATALVITAVLGLARE
eukprot:10973111-Ditylum_brightwellii.AAC.1